MDLSGSESTPVIDEAGFPLEPRALAHDTWSLIGSPGKSVQGIQFSTLQLFDWSLSRSEIRFKWFLLDEYWRLVLEKWWRKEWQIFTWTCLQFRWAGIQKIGRTSFIDWYTGLPTRFNSLDWKTLSLNPLKDVTIQK